MIRFNGEEIAELAGWTKNVLKSGARKGAISAANRLVSIIQTEVIPNENPPPVDIGTFRMGFRAEPTDDGAVVINTAPHAKIIEYGARAENIKVGRKMIDALVEWIMRKGLVLTPKGLKIIHRTFKTPESRKTAETEARQLAWAIAQNMKKRGIFNRNDEKGLQITRKALKRGRAMIIKEVITEIKKAIKSENPRSLPKV